jgi:Transposase DDE domain
LARLVETGGQGVRVRRLGGDRAGEIRLTRFLRNEAVTPEKMVGEAARSTAERCAGRRVLAIQDSTVVRSEGGGGLYLHPMLMVEAESGAILGLADAVFLSRTQGKKVARVGKPVSDKESQRWLDGAKAAAEVCRAADSVTVISDRESDIYEAFVLRPERVDLLIRAAQDRALEDEGRLFATLDAQPIAARAELDLPPAPGRKARTATMAVRFMPAKLRRPTNRPAAAGLPVSVEVTAVDIREIDPPAGAAPVHWRLLTTLPVSDGAQALGVADLYRRRWAIEQLFRTMKAKGFDIEGMLIEAEPPLQRLVMATLIAAVIIQQLVHARDGDVGHGALRPMTDAFEAEDQTLLQALCAKLEGKTQRQKNPHPKGSLAYAAWVCARLGGWTGYYGKPGPIVMLQGWLQFQAAKHGVRALRDYPDV